MTAIPIRGVACPYGHWASLKENGVYERIMPGAFGRMLAKKRDHVTFLIGGHDGRQIASTADGARLFEHNDVGLCFEFRLDQDIRDDCLAVYSIVRHGYNRASVQFTEMSARHVRRERDSQWQSFFTVDIDHVAIVPSAAYSDTAVWRADISLDRAPSRIQRRAYDWARASRYQPQVEDAPALAPELSAPSAINTRLAAQLAPHMTRYRNVRQSFMAALMSGQMPDGICMGHAAFSRAGGFDGNWNDLLREVRQRGKR
jgi:HK97 family phage prohead protease